MNYLNAIPQIPMVLLLLCCVVVLISGHDSSEKSPSRSDTSRTNVDLNGKGKADLPHFVKRSTQNKRKSRKCCNKRNQRKQNDILHLEVDIAESGNPSGPYKLQTTIGTFTSWKRSEFYKDKNDFATFLVNGTISIKSKKRGLYMVYASFAVMTYNESNFSTGYPLRIAVNGKARISCDNVMKFGDPNRTEYHCSISQVLLLGKMDTISVEGIVKGLEMVTNVDKNFWGIKKFI